MSPIQAPEDVERRAVALAADLGLPVAGVDLMIDEDGDVYCLEVNPSPVLIATSRSQTCPALLRLGRGGLIKQLATALNRIADRVRPAGTLATIEDPMTVARLGTFTTLAAAGSSAAFAILFYLFDEPVAAGVTIGLSAGFLGLWVWSAFGSGSRRILAVVRVAVIITAANHILVHLALGGYANSGAYLSFGIAVTLVASLVLGRVESIVNAMFYTLVAIGLGFLEGTLSASRPAPNPTLSTILFVIVLIGGLFMLIPTFLYFLERLSSERERAEALLLNVLPQEVAAELKQRGETTARRFDSISVLFADMVGFTPMSTAMEPEQVVSRLNEVFTFFDFLADKYACEKIRTMGDAYMVASGVPVPRGDHALAIAAMALDMLDYARNGPLRFRIGINSGPAMAGVIGTKKFQYDVWGDTVNIASRMESQGQPGKIQIAQGTYDLVKYRYQCIPHGPIEVKGRGPLHTWYLERSRERVPWTSDER